MATGTIPEPFAWRDKYGSSVTLKGVYTSASNTYVLPCAGLLGVRLSGTQTGAARVCGSSDTTYYLQLGTAAGGYITYLPKGMQVYIAGNVDAAFFMPLE